LLIAGVVYSAAVSQPVGKKPKDGKLSIAVSELDGRGLQPGEASTLTDALSSHLSNTGKIRVMERGKMDMVLKEQGFQQSGACTDEACVVEMGQLLGVDNMVTGSIGKVGKTYSVNVRMISVSSGEILRTVSKNYKGEIDGLLTDVIPQVAREFAGLEDGAPAMVKSEPVSAQPSQAPAPKSEPVKSEPQVRSEGKGMSPVLVAVLAVAVVGGSVAAFLILTKKDETTDAPAGGGNNTGNQTGTVDVTW
jgi:TolB-like protein